LSVVRLDGAVEMPIAAPSKLWIRVAKGMMRLIGRIFKLIEK
jgi:hypothetical protein